MPGQSRCYLRSSRNKVPAKTDEVARKIPDAPFGPGIITLDRSALSHQATGAGVACIIDVETVASFNWRGGPSAHISVPGLPPKWTPLEKPRRLPEDMGTFYRDPNAARYPQFTLDSTAEAVMKMKGSCGEVLDIVACASTLGNLLRFARGIHPNFRIPVQRIGDTVHFIRREKAPKETIDDVHGYGHTFPEAYTTWDPSVRNSTSHQRAIRYRLGGLSCLVRFEAEGYITEKTDGMDLQCKAEADDSASVEALLSSLSLQSSTAATASSSLKITNAGSLVPQRALMDIKTRSIRHKNHKEAIVAGEMPRLWIRQVENFMLAYHQCGTFYKHEMELRDVGAEMKEWERDNEKSIMRFVEVLNRIVDFARKRKDGKFEISGRDGEGRLHFREQIPDTPQAFSPDVERRWQAWLNGRADSAGDGSGSEGDSDEVEMEESSAESEHLDFSVCDNECDYCGRCV